MFTAALGDAHFVCRKCNKSDLDAHDQILFKCSGLNVFCSSTPRLVVPITGRIVCAQVLLSVFLKSVFVDACSPSPPHETTSHTKQTTNKPVGVYPGSGHPEPPYRVRRVSGPPNRATLELHRAPSVFKRKLRWQQHLRWRQQKQQQRTQSWFRERRKGWRCGGVDGIYD